MTTPNSSILLKFLAGFLVEGGGDGGWGDISGTGVVAGGRASEREDAGPPLLDDGIVAMDDSRTMKGGEEADCMM